MSLSGISIKSFEGYDNPTAARKVFLDYIHSMPDSKKTHALGLVEVCNNHQDLDIELYELSTEELSANLCREPIASRKTPDSERLVRMYEETPPFRY